MTDLHLTVTIGDLSDGVDAELVRYDVERYLRDNLPLDTETLEVKLSVADPAADMVRSLYEQALGPGESELLDDLRKRAGLVWECDTCHWHNVAEDATCENCGARQQDLPA